MSEQSARAVRLERWLLAMNRALHTELGSRILKRNLAWKVASWARPAAMVATAGTATEETFYEAARAKARKLIPYLRPESQVLDLGCGLGRFERFLAPHCAQIIGLDPVPGFLRRAARENARLPNAVFRLGTGSDLVGISDSSMDFVFSVGVFERLPKAVVCEYLGEIRRVLTPKGKAYLEFLVTTAPRFIGEDGTVWDASVYTFWTRKEVVADAEAAGLTAESSEQEGHVLTVVFGRL